MDSRDAASSASSRFISQIIYPDVDLNKFKGDAHLIGWNLDNFRCSIACIVPIAPNKISHVYDALALSANDLAGSLASCSKHGRSKPVILGELRMSTDTAYIPSAEKQACGIWITLYYDKNENGDAQTKPRLHSLYSLGCKYATSVYIFRYNRALSNRLECFFVKRTYRNQKLAHVKKNGNKLENNYVNTNNGTLKGALITDLEVIIGHINTANELRERLDYYLDLAAGRSTNISNYYDALHPFTSLAEQYFSNSIGFACTFMARIVGFWCEFLRVLNRLLSHRFELFRLGNAISHWLGLSGIGSIETIRAQMSNRSPAGIGSVQGIAMRDLSLTCAFVSERASMCILAVQKCALFPVSWNLPCAMKQRLWLEVHALVLLLWVDVLLGSVVGYYMFTNAEAIVLHLSALCQKLQSMYILETLEWFNHLPGGVKLNTTITYRMSGVLTSAVLSFEWFLLVTQPMHAGLLRFIACCGGFGCSVQLVMLVDLMRLLSLHIALIHRILSSLHHFLLQCLHTLWLLFNGQKNNILRKRIDTCLFGQDQLLFGIVLFSIVFFAFPTFAVYFFLFTLAQFVCVSLQYLVYSLSVLLKEFPYYEAVMFVTCPGIMSDGVQFSISPNQVRAIDVGCDLSDNFNSHCQSLWDSWRALSSPIISSPLQGRSRTRPSPHETVFIPLNKDALQRGEQLTRPVQSQPRSTHLDTVVTTNLTLPLLSVSKPLSAPRGILKSQERSLDACAGSQCRPNEGASPGRNRVSFQANTVRTIEQYHSEGESGNSAEEERNSSSPESVLEGKFSY